MTGAQQMINKVAESLCSPGFSGEETVNNVPDSEYSFPIGMPLSGTWLSCVSFYRLIIHK
jgi:hypothetical protein